MLQSSEAKLALEREAAHQHNHALRGEVCPFRWRPWPWQVADCSALTSINAVMPISAAAGAAADIPGEGGKEYDRGREYGELRVKNLRCDKERDNSCRGGLIDGGSYAVKAEERITLCYHCLHRLLDDAERRWPAPRWPDIAIYPGIIVYGPAWHLGDVVEGRRAEYILPAVERWTPPETHWQDTGEEDMDYG